LLERIAETITRYSMFAPGLRLGVAVSGGSDSIALLCALHALAPRWNLALTVLHVNHRLRGAESDGDEQFVRETAARLGLPAVVGQAELHPDQANLEESARLVRYRFFEEAARQLELGRMATGHTLDDQAETVLFRLLRGSGTAGLGGIRAVAGRIVRPLIEMREHDVRDWLNAIGQPWREDSSNRERRFARNRIRMDLLPLLREWNPNVDEALARVASLAAADDEHLDREAAALAGRLCRDWCDGVVLDAPAAAALAPALRGRLLRTAIEKARGSLRGIEWQHLRRVEGLSASGTRTASAALPGLRAIRSFDSLLLIRPDAMPVPYRYEPASGLSRWWDLPGRRLWLGPVGDPPGGPDVPFAESSYNTGCACCHRIVVYGAWELRSWRPGDRFRLRQHGASKKLKDWFQIARIPSWERPLWPIIQAEGSVVWASGLGPAATSAGRAGEPGTPVSVLEVGVPEHYCAGSGTQLGDESV
jgi:tRNA(Ile)-lysidine synthase